MPTTAAEKTQALDTLNDLQVLLPEIKDALTQLERVHMSVDMSWPNRTKAWIMSAMNRVDAAGPGVGVAKTIVNGVTTTE